MDIKVAYANFEYKSCKIYGYVNGEIILIVSCEDLSKQDCCEDACVEYYETTDNKEVLVETPKDITNNIITDIKYTNEYISRLYIYFDNGEILVIEPNNNHNGYYPHTFEIKYMDKIIYEEVGKKPIDLNDVVSMLNVESCTL